MGPDFRQSVAKGGFKVSREANDFCTLLKNKFGFAYNYDAARLCIARSLAEPVHLSDTPGKSADSSTPIRGENLLGEQLDLWICIIVQAGGLGPEATPGDFRKVVEAHWERGARRLRDDWEAAGKDDIEFLSRVAVWLPEVGPSAPTGATGEDRGAVAFRIGEVSRTLSGDEVEVIVNAPGVTPHIALMGQAGKGKTRSGILIAADLAKNSGAPILILDPKGDFVDGGQVRPEVATMFPGVRAVELGLSPVPLDFLPHADSGQVAVTQAAMRFRDSLVQTFRVSGDKQREFLRQAVEAVITGRQERDLNAVLRSYETLPERAGHAVDSVSSKLRELTALRLFTPDMPASEFFEQSWVISMKGLQADEVKKVAILLILDALASHVLAQDDSPAPGGFRVLRHILFIDEARRILAEKKYQSLVDLLRQGRSKGEVVVLISQDPSDFDGQADDFTSQLGTVVAFACPALRGLRALQGAYGRKLQPREFSDEHLTDGVAFAKLPGRAPERVRCWGGPE